MPNPCCPTRKHHVPVPRGKKITGVDVIKSVDEAIERSLADSGEDEIAGIPERLYVVPFLHPAT